MPIHNNAYDKAKQAGRNEVVGEIKKSQADAMKDSVLGQLDGSNQQMAADNEQLAIENNEMKAILQSAGGLGRGPEKGGQGLGGNMAGYLAIAAQVADDAGSQEEYSEAMVTQAAQTGDPQLVEGVMQDESVLPEAKEYLAQLIQRNQ